MYNTIPKECRRAFLPVIYSNYGGFTIGISSKNELNMVKNRSKDEDKVENKHDRQAFSFESYFLISLL